MNEFLFVVVPYICLTIFVVGHVWRYRYDKFGWTTRSSQLYENRLLRIGSPLFHFGILGVFFGHVIGLGIPESWTEAVGISEGMYHFVAVSVGALAGARDRRRDGHPDLPPADRRPGVLGDHADGQGDVRLPRHGDPARAVQHRRGEPGRRLQLPRGGLGLVPRHLPVRPAPGPDGRGAVGFQLHGLVALALFALWPFTRLVHVFSAPLGYLTRPYIVYRSRDDVELGSHRPRRGWDRVG